MEQRPPDSAVQQACALAAQVVRARPSALVTDFDGTLSPIVPSPEDASVLPGCRRALEALRDRLELVAVISGRAGSDVQRLLGLERVVYLGNHGLEPWIGSDRPNGWPAEMGLRGVLDEVEEALPGQPGLRFEDKGATASIHYRSAPDRERARSLVLAAAEESAARHGLAVGEGKMVVELRPSHWAGKGSALSELVRKHGIRGLVYLGDDAPDVHAFETLARARQEGRLRGLSIGVTGPESPPELSNRADVVLAGPEQAEAFLEALVRALS